MNNNGLLAAVLKIREILDGDSETVSAKRSLFSTPIGLLTTELQLLKISTQGHMTSEA